MGTWSIAPKAPLRRVGVPIGERHIDLTLRQYDCPADSRFSRHIPMIVATAAASSTGASEVYL